MTIRERLAWLAAATPHAEPGPYNQLAACLRAAGLSQEANQALREKLRRAARARGRFRQAWGLLQDLTVGYGYLPGRAVAGVVALLAFGTVYFSTVTCGPAPGLCPVKADEHPAWDPFLYVLDLLIPVVGLGHDTAWDPTGTSKAVALVLIAAGWVLVTTVAAAAARSLNRALTDRGPLRRSSARASAREPIAEHDRVRYVWAAPNPADDGVRPCAG
jgi:hypothetical protein